MTDTGSRRVFLVIVLVFGAAIIATAIFGWIVVQNVRVTASRTDLDMRTVAWASIAWACEHDGRFPVDEGELLSMQSLPETISCVPTGSESWPRTRQDALRGEDPPELEAALGRIRVYFSSDGALPPAISPGGLPMLLDTEDTVIGWLGSFEEARGDGRQ